MADYAEPPIADPGSLDALLSSLGATSAPVPPAAPLNVATPQPVPSAPMPPLPMPPVNHGIDWKQLIDFVGPLAGLIGSGNQAHRTGFATGWTEAHQQAEAVRAEKAQQDQKMRELGANYLLKIADQAQTIQDPAEYQQFIDLADTAGSRAGYTQPGELKTKLQFPASRLNANKLNEIKNELDSYEKNGYNLDDLAQSNAHLTLKDGTTIPFSTALDMTRRRPLGEDNAALPKPEKIGNTEEERFVAQWAKDNGKVPGKLSAVDDLTARTLFRQAGKAAPAGDDYSRFLARYAGEQGTTVDKLTTAQELAARKQFNTAAQDPQMSDLNLQLKQLQLDALRQKNKDAASTSADILPGSKEYKVASDLAEGRLTFQQLRTLYSYSRDVNKKLAIYDKASEINPNFSPAAFEMGYKFASNPKVQSQIASINNVLSGVGDLMKASDAASRSGVTVLNKFIVPGGIAIGGKKYTDFKTAQIAFADELSGALGYGSATDMSREMGFNMTDPNLSPENFRSAIENIIVPFVHRKKASLTGQMGPYGSTVGPNSGQPSNPKEIRYDANGNVIK